MTKRDCRIAAGLFMGEGSVGIYRQHRKDREFSYVLRVQLGMNDKDVVFWLHQHWGGCVTHCTAKHRTRVHHCWRLYSRASIPFLKDIRPFVFGEKLPQIILALDFQSRQRVGRWLTAQEKEYKKNVSEKMHQLKKGLDAT